MDISYEAAMAELRTILQEIQDETITIDDLAERTRRAQELLLHCRSKLRNTEAEVDQVLKQLE